MSEANGEVQSGLEGVVAFATEIAEPDKAGGALRYRGVDIEELVGVVPFEQVWGLLVDGHLKPGLGPPRRRKFEPRPAAGRAVAARDPLGQPAGRRPVGACTTRARMGLQ